jgi:6-pyruvoyltetrahydropterin/6-carboxytetrahydropterin synthase
MGHYLLSSEARFSAAHTLAGVDKCAQLHGHNWKVRITVRVTDQDLDERGMGVDFRAIEQIASDCIADFEHQYLNDLEPFKDAQPTAEYLARLVAERAEPRLKEAAEVAELEEIAVWEMPEYRVVYRP